MSQISHLTPSFAHRHRLEAPNRRRIRFAAAGLAAITSLLYVLIATSVVSVIDAGAVENARHDQMAFATPAAIAYAIGAVLLLLPLMDRRILWVAGALLQMGVIIMYFSVAADREPSFEPWGIAIEVVQVLLLAALVALAVDEPERAR